MVEIDVVSRRGGLKFGVESDVRNVLFGVHERRQHGVGAPSMGIELVAK